jgi:hypothetical protein
MTLNPTAASTQVSFPNGCCSATALDRLDSPTENSKSGGLTETPKTEAIIIKNAQGAWGRLRVGLAWEDWATVGAAHVIGRTTAMRDAHTNKPAGRGYNAAFAAWATKYGFDLDKGDRSRLFKVMDNLAAIEAWRAKQPPTEQLRLNHPSTVLRKWRASTVVPDPNAPPKLSPYKKLQADHMALIAEHDRYKREVARGGGDLWCADDTPRDIARIMLVKLGKTKVEKVAREFRAALKAAAQ